MQLSCANLTCGGNVLPHRRLAGVAQREDSKPGNPTQNRNTILETMRM
jgi:hypothetical protein